MTFTPGMESGRVDPGFAPNLSGVPVIGKYGPGQQPIFDVKAALVVAGVEVAMPIGSASSDSFHGYTFTDPLEQYVPFNEMQQRFFGHIASSPYVIACTDRVEDDREVKGLIGFSTAHELAWAALHGRSIVLTSPVDTFSRYVPQALVDVITEIAPMCIVQDIRKLGVDGLRTLLGQLPSETNYHLSGDQRQAVTIACSHLERIELHRWLSWTLKTECDFAAGLRPDWIDEHEHRMYEEPAAYLPLGDMLHDANARAYLQSVSRYHCT